ncbi:N-acetyltransferase [Sphingomonas koreensis]|nr:N-acetyltransferase [Sphingomonas koreensis]
MIETERLVLRTWREADKPAFHDIINTPAMMAHFGGIAPRAAIDALIDMMIAAQDRDGYSMWAVETKADGALAGICGLRHQIGYPELPVYGELEIGWRIAECWWGQGVAREAAEASLAWGWANTDFARIAAWTSIGNTRSWGLMTRLGMKRHAELDFHHPKVATDDPDGDMIVYAIDRPQ